MRRAILEEVCVSVENELLLLLLLILICDKIIQPQTPQTFCN